MMRDNRQPLPARYNGTMKITYLSHSCFLVETASHTILIDPYLSANPLAQIKPEDIRCDFILVTHGHFDHVGDAAAIASANDATVISSYEVIDFLGRQGVKKGHPMGLGGGYDFPFGRVKLTVALHSAGYKTDEAGDFQYLGVAAGILLTTEGTTIYHAGDTALTMEMQLIGQRNKIDIAMLPIGDNFTMGPEDAVAAAEFLKPGLVLPMHYNTFPPIKQAAKGIAGKAIGIGETITV
jgi:L-ascorbate metabolism protein UlaG (beta-lactamase superfamily)